MKFAACVFAAIIAVAFAVPAPMQQDYQKSYGAGGLAVPCPKSVVISCAPLLQKVPCKGGASAGYQGAYSEYAPQYASEYAAAPEYYNNAEY